MVYIPFIYCKNIKYIRRWAAVNEVMLKIEIEMEKGIKTTLLVLYAPNEGKMAKEIEVTE